MLKVPLTQQHSKIAWSDPEFAPNFRVDNPLMLYEK